MKAGQSYCSAIPPLRGNADKSLPRPGRRQATRPNSGFINLVTRSSVPSLARCSIFCKPLKKNSEGCPSNEVFAAAITTASNENWLIFNTFSVYGTGGSPTGSDPENRVGDQDTGSPGRPVSSGLQVPGEPGHCRARTRPPLVTFPRLWCFSFKMSFNCTSRDE